MERNDQGKKRFRTVSGSLKVQMVCQEPQYELGSYVNAVREISN